MAAASATSSGTQSQLSCFSSINRSLHQLHLHRRRSISFPSSPRLPKFSVVMSAGGRATGTPDSDPYKGYESASKSMPYGEETNVEENSRSADLGVEKKSVYGSAMIHDFCFGIPFGALVLSGGIIGLLFSRTYTTFSGVLIGGGLLAFSTYSLKIWRQGKSSLPFVFGQAVLSAALLWKNVEVYSLTKSLFPAGFYAAISAAMLCFYIHVFISGGNPPPKKLQS
ncbi:unnamed protein product [Linum trigynum]|uniref:Protein FATTY ACID EXPORT 1, chloroplastic n=1 Tax=Linum trigynum TaxID=586398 RepID=A0AAV2EJ30_9ROSI